MFFLFLRLEHPAGWICARYKSLLLLLFESDFLVYLYRQNALEILYFIIKINRELAVANCLPT